MPCRLRIRKRVMARVRRQHHLYSLKRRKRIAASIIYRGKKR